MPAVSAAQGKLIAAIAARGVTDVDGSKLFYRRRSGGFDAATSTIVACTRRDWIRRDERDGVAYWSVTDKAPLVDANGLPVRAFANATVDFPVRMFFAGRVRATECPHYMAASEARAGLKKCERC